MRGRDLGKLGKSTMDDYCGASERCQRLPAGQDRCGIAIDPEQPASRCDPLQNLAGVTRLPEGAVDCDCPVSGLEQLYYLL